MTGGGWRLTVPPAFAAGVERHGGAAGRAWLDALPDLVDALLAQWDLMPEGGVGHGFLGLVLPVHRDGERLALKVGRPSPEVDNQVRALVAWDGRGMVRLDEADQARGALLLERLDENRTLADVDPDRAHRIAARLVRRLAVPAGDADLPTLRAHLADWPGRWERESTALGHPLPAAVTAAAREVLRSTTPVDHLLVDHDLHLGNVAAGTREPWLALDPRGVVGDAEYAVAPVLWNGFRGTDDLRERFATFVDVAGLDRQRLGAWTLVRVVDHFLWSTATGLTWDPAACAAIADWIVADRHLLP